jgi:LCP family protein required for cell wall assembly
MHWLAGRGSVPRLHEDDEGVGHVAVPDRDLAYFLERPAGRYWRCNDLRNGVIQLLEPTRRGGKVLRRPATPASALRRLLRLAGRIGLALVSAMTLILTGYAWTLSRELNASPTTSAVLDHPSSADRVGSAGSRPTAATDPTNLLLVGLDSRTDAQGHPLPPEVLTALHAGGDDGEVNTDALILVHVPTESSQPTIAVSIPRDSYVTVPGFGAHKINSAYHQEVVKATSTLAAQGINGPQLDRLARQAGRRELIQTVEQLTGLTLDHYAEINLAGFYEITQAVGGVPICLTAPVHDSYTGADFPAGPQTVSGAAALAFVRQRHGLPRGDLDRILRQQAYLSGLAHRLLSGGVLTNPGALTALREAIARYVVIDPGWNLTELLQQTPSISEGAIQFQTIPTGRTNLPTPDGEAVQVDPDQVQQFMMQLTGSGNHTLNPPTSTTPDIAPMATSLGCVS